MEVNFVAVIVAAIAGFAIGWAWYSDFLFAKTWRREMGIAEGSMKMEGMGKTMALGFVAVLVMAYVLSNLILATGAFTIASALVLSVWVWFGFVATVLMGSVLWEQKSWKLFGINAAHYLVVILVMATILVYWL